MTIVYRLVVLLVMFTVGSAMTLTKSNETMPHFSDQPVDGAANSRLVSNRLSCNNKRVVGYFTSWGSKGITTHQASYLTHVIYAFIEMQPDGSLVLGPEADGKQLESRIAHLMDVRKQLNGGLKVLFAVGGWSNSQYFSASAASEEKTQRFVADIEVILERYDFDGVDIDWEYPVTGGADEGIPADRNNYVSILRLIRNRLRRLQFKKARTEPYLLTIASAAGSWVLDVGYDLENMIEIVDWINVMTYDYFGAWASKAGANTGPTAPLFHGAPKGFSGKMNADYTLKYYVCGTHTPNKIVMGLPFYGRYWNNVGEAVERNNQLWRLAEPDSNGNFEGGFVEWSDIKANWLDRQSYQSFYDDKTATPFLWSPSERVFMGYDNPKSLVAKVSYAARHSLGGVMIWAIDMDDESDTLIKAVRSVDICLAGTERYTCNPIGNERRWWTPEDKQPEKNGMCGRMAPLYNGFYPVCDPDDPGYSCCGRWGYCGGGPESCDCPNCVNYAKNPERVLEQPIKPSGPVRWHTLDSKIKPGQPRCGRSSALKLENGLLPICNPDDNSAHCCSPAGYCGNTNEYCKCNGCVDFKEMLDDDIDEWMHEAEVPKRNPLGNERRWWTPDDQQPEKNGMCGRMAPIYNGFYPVCDPDNSGYSCCGRWGYCGGGPESCDCPNCINYAKNPERVLEEPIKPSGPVRWHTLDSKIKPGLPRCGRMSVLKLESTLFPICNPDDNSAHCCSPAGYCGSTYDFCKCKGCVDFKEMSDSNIEDWMRGNEVPTSNQNLVRGETPIESSKGNERRWWTPEDEQPEKNGLCGKNAPLYNGFYPVCDPNNPGYSCCSEWGYCGGGSDFCDCPKCVNYAKNPKRVFEEPIKPSGPVRWHTLDSKLKPGLPRCGPLSSLKLENGLFPICNPDSNGTHCCSPSGYCGHTDDFCKCKGCVNFKEMSDSSIEDWMRGFEVPTSNQNLIRGKAPIESSQGNERRWWTPEEEQPEKNGLCGKNAPLYNGFYPVCDPNNPGYSCCSEWGYCGGGTDFCDCPKCVNYAKNPERVFEEPIKPSGPVRWHTLDSELKPGLPRCGPMSTLKLENGLFPICNPDSNSTHCCSPAGYCGSTDDYCKCNGCVDFKTMTDSNIDDWMRGIEVTTPNQRLQGVEVLIQSTEGNERRWWTSDDQQPEKKGMCGKNAPLYNGFYPVCDPSDPANSCCSQWGYCGGTAEFCACPNCIDYAKNPERVFEEPIKPSGPVRWHTLDSELKPGLPRCGPMSSLKLENGLFPICNPDSNSTYCCSPAGYCGSTDDYCKCKGCVDFREMTDSDIDDWMRSGKGRIRNPLGTERRWWTSEDQQPEKKGMCGKDAPLYNGFYPVCDPDDPAYSCCSQWGYCSGGPESCDCPTCINYAKNPERILEEPVKPSGTVKWHTLDSNIQSGLPRCGPMSALKLDNGLFPICNPDSNSTHCCSAAGYCGNSDKFCKCDGCTDFRRMNDTEIDSWMSGQLTSKPIKWLTRESKILDGEPRCGRRSSLKLENGLFPICNPNDRNKYCCSPAGYCGSSDKFCKCDGCTDFRQMNDTEIDDWMRGELTAIPFKWHTLDSKLKPGQPRCGRKSALKLENGLIPICNPNDKSGPCCSPSGYCGRTDDFCKCNGCADFKEMTDSQIDEWMHIQLIPIN